MARYGIGSTGRSATAVAAPPTAPGNGSGGPGELAGLIPGTLGGSIDDLGNVMTGRITLSLLALVILGMGAFYIGTRSVQGGG